MIGALSEKQKDFVFGEKAWINVLYGSVRSSKTVAANMAWLDFIANYRHKEPLLMFGKTERTLRRNVIDPIAASLGKHISTGSGEFELWGTRIHTVGANDERAVDKIQGPTYGGAYGDEWVLAPQSFSNMLFTRLSVPGARAFLTCNPGSPYHYVKTDYLDNPRLNLKSWHFTLDDNLHLSEDYVDNLKRTYTGLFYKRYILGQWVVAEGAVYDMFDDRIHVVYELPRMKRYFVGVDYGTNNPTVFVLIGQSMDNKFYICREYYHDGGNSRQKTDSEYVKDLKGFLPKQYENVVIDPSAKSFIVACQRAGVRSIRQADNAVLDGIRSVSSLLHNNLLFCHKSCTNVIREFQSYSWDIKAQERGEDKPMKESDHALDGLRYAFHTNYRFWKGILDHKAQTIDRLEGARL